MTTFASKFDEQFAGSDKEFILVALDGNTMAGGSFYVNSKASGNWEDYVIDELVSYIDENYRTIATADSRGISGYSMGGFGALYISLRHPDTFSSTLVFCPGIFADNDLEAVLRTWSGATDVKKTYAQAFSPNLKDTKNYGNIIQDSDIKAKNQVWKDWMNGYSNFDQKIKDYLALKKPLKSIMINYSEKDYFDWIPRGCEDLIDQLEENGINHSSNTFIGGHIVPYDAVKMYFVPFFSENLNYK
jgi:S-formylglutathione hydrolase FrmB